MLNKTGGIVQGMSGSPIIQNNKIIGAITHVTKNNPRKGYGIFIDENGIVCENSTDGIARALMSIGKSAKSMPGDFDNEKQRKQLDALLTG